MYTETTTHIQTHTNTHPHPIIQTNNLFNRPHPMAKAESSYKFSVYLNELIHLGIVARVGPRPTEVGSPQTLEDQELSSRSLFPSISSFAFLPSVFLCFYCLTALPTHSPTLGQWPSSTRAMTQSKNVTTCRVAKQSLTQKLHQYCDPQSSSRRTNKHEKKREKNRKKTLECGSRSHISSL